MSSITPVLVAALALSADPGRILNAQAGSGASPPAAGSGRREGATIAFENGRWFDGDGFERGTRFAVGGLLSSTPPERVDLTLDLDGGWVVPPYGEAHTHFLEGEQVERYEALYLRRGVFYAREQAGSPGIRRRFEELFNRPTSVDFVSANQGFTGPGGHPLQILLQVQSIGGFPPSWTLEDFQGEAIFVVDTQDEVDQAWSAFLEGDPDFLKIFLLYSEEHEKRQGQPEYTYRCGLDPALVPGLVERAHAAGLEVSAHIYTRADFRTAVDLGVDQIAHFPGIGFESELGIEAFLLTDEDAAAAGDARVSVVTTLSDMAGGPGPVSPGTRDYVDKVILPNLTKLLEADVPILIGSDRVRMTTDVEATTLAALELFDSFTLLKMWCEDTPRSIFPDRKIGRLSDGYEASFLVLEGDPLEDFANTQRIGLRVKQGHLLFPQEPKFPPLGGR